MSEFTLDQNAIGFFVYTYFGIAFEELIDGNKKDDIIIKCAKRAYRDLNRTLSFKDDLSATDLKESEKNGLGDQHESFCKFICNEIKEYIAELLTATSRDAFDEKHDTICCAIIDKATASGLLSEIKHRKSEHKRVASCFYYGQAQKWLNMTLKYMWLLGLWKEEFENVLPFLHVPVDSFIIEAVWHEGQPENDKEQLINQKFDDWSIVLPCDKKDRRGKYNQDKIIPWSKWTYNEYYKFQKDIRESPLLDGMYPIVWEGPAWSSIAEKRRTV